MTATTGLDETSVVAAVGTGLRLGGREVPIDRRFAVEDPSTGATLTEVADAAPSVGIEALDIAASTQARWADTFPRDRAEVLRRTFELLSERSEEVALLMTLEMGKPLAESRAEVAYGAEFFRWFSEEAARIDGNYLRNPGGPGRFLIMRQPVGPCFLITPWNFPLAMAARKIAPALAAGCTVIVKPSELTPLSMLVLADIMADAGLPQGVLSVLPTTDPHGLATAILADRRLRKLSFTGSTRVGRLLLHSAAENVLRVSMELGGNAPLIVFEDADLDLAIEGTMTAKLRNIGQACTSANRIYVHATVADDFTSMLTERFAALKVGRGTDPGVAIGPLISQTARTKVDDLVRDAVERGADVLTGGGSIAGHGWFFEPTVLAGHLDGSRISHEEIFGPVATVRTFTDEREVVSWANDTAYGLASYVFSRDVDRVLRVSEQLEVGMVGVNQGIVGNAAAPFGGVKHSGLGREGSFAGMDEYLELKVLAIAESRSP